MTGNALPLGQRPAERIVNQWIGQGRERGRGFLYVSENSMIIEIQRREYEITTGVRLHYD